MKKLLLSIVSLAFAFNSFSGMAQGCAVDGGAPTPVAPATEACASNFNANDLVIGSYSSQGSLNTTQIVVSTMVNDSSLIVGLSDNGAFDFATGNAGAAFAYGDYQFTVFSYNQTELNALAAQLNPLLPLLGYPTIPTDANGNVSLTNVFSTLALVFPGLTIEDVQYAICTFLPTLGASLNYGLSAPYTVTWKASGCVSGINTATDNNINVTVNSTTAIIDLNSSASANVAIFDLSGKTLAQQVVSGSATFDISAYPAGMYIVRANNVTTKFVK